MTAPNSSPYTGGLERVFWCFSTYTFQRFFLYDQNRGTNIYFIEFFKIFSIQEDVSHEVVMIRWKAADESLLSDVAVNRIIKAAIRQTHLLESIFHLFILNILREELMYWGFK